MTTVILSPMFSALNVTSRGDPRRMPPRAPNTRSRCLGEHRQQSRSTGTLDCTCAIVSPSSSITPPAQAAIDGGAVNNDAIDAGVPRAGRCAHRQCPASPAILFRRAIIVPSPPAAVRGCTRVSRPFRAASASAAGRESVRGHRAFAVAQRPRSSRRLRFVARLRDRVTLTRVHDRRASRRRRRGRSSAGHGVPERSRPRMLDGNSRAALDRIGNRDRTPSGTAERQAPAHALLVSHRPSGFRLQPLPSNRRGAVVLPPRQELDRAVRGNLEPAPHSIPSRRVKRVAAEARVTAIVKRMSVYPRRRRRVERVSSPGMSVRERQAESVVLGTRMP